MSRRVRIGVTLAAAGVFALLFVQAHARWATFHNETFDLAFYTRMAWGLAHGSFWEPIVNAHVLGLHISPVLVPLGLLGYAFPLPPLLLACQALALAATAWPMARIGHARLGEPGAILGALAWFLFPNLGHVGTYEFHPGTLAVLPLAWAIEGVVRGAPRTVVIGCVGVLLCREDLALVTFGVALVAYRSGPAFRRVGPALAVGSLAYLALFLFVLHPAFAPHHGSLQDHFGSWGDSIPEALLAMITQPGALFDHLTEGGRLSYLPRLLAPLSFLPLLRPRWLLVATPVLAINLLSEWPTTIELDSHYQTIALPLLVAGALEGADRVRAKLRPWHVVGLVGACLVGGHLMWGGTPIATDYEPEHFHEDARSAAARRIVEAIPEGESVQAPYAILPHVAERDTIARPPPPERTTDWLVLDAWHRTEYAHREELLRTTEEPIVRGWLARSDHGLVAVEPPYFLLQRGADPRGGPAARYLRGTADPTSGRRLTGCLHLAGSGVSHVGLALDFVATGPCPRDLAIRIGTGRRPPRVDLLFDGVLSPAHLREGDRVRSMHPLSAEERRHHREGELRVGLLRESGARPEHEDPMTIPLLTYEP